MTEEELQKKLEKEQMYEERKQKYKKFDFAEFVNRENSVSATSSKRKDLSTPGISPKPGPLPGKVTKKVKPSEKNISEDIE